MKVSLIGAGVFLLGLGLGIGAVAGYKVGSNGSASFSGLIIRSLCANEGYDGAYFPLANPEEAKCVTDAELTALTSTD